MKLYMLLNKKIMSKSGFQIPNLIGFQKLLMAIKKYVYQLTIHHPILDFLPIIQLAALIVNDKKMAFIINPLNP